MVDCILTCILLCGFQDCETTDDFWCYAVWRRGEEEVEGVVPSTWIVGQKVLWPPTNGRQAVKERHKPGPKWTTHNLIKVKLFSESLATCERYCSTSSEEVTENSESDYEPSPQRKRRRRKKKTGQDNGTGPDQVHKEQSEDDTRTSRGESGSPPPPPKKKRTVTNDRPGEPEAETSAVQLEPHLEGPELRGLDDSHHEDNIRIVGAHSSNTWEVTFTPPQPPDGGLDFPLPTGEFQEQVLGLLLDIQNTLRNLGGRIEALEHNVTHFEVCRTFDDLAALEHSMASPEAAAQMKQYLSRIGGNSLRSNVGKVMERLMTNELMSHFNVKGSKGRKRSFDSSPLKKIIIDSVMIAHPHATETAISQMIANALKQAPDRRGGVGRCRQPIVIKHEII